ncbi:Uncharacterised protein [Mycobacteroides abscessus subsp. abscessus]|nr:Uncharacterised protein [Mycobacteroides abscessus subsp. abscessus]
MTTFLVRALAGVFPALLAGAFAGALPFRTGLGSRSTRNSPV